MTRAPRRPGPPLVAGARREPLALSFAQQRLWFVEQLEPGASYNVSVAFRLHGRIDAAALEAALQALVARHEGLRTSFVSDGGEPRQVIAPAATIALAREDVASVAAMRAVAQREASTAFDLTRAPLLRARLVRIANSADSANRANSANSANSANDHALVVVTHHIVCDNWSLGILVGELAALYGSRTAGAPAGLAPLAVQYADFARWQRDWLAGAEAGGELARLTDYWRAQLAGVPAGLDLPSDRARPAVRSGRGARMPIALACDVAALTAFSRGERATLYMTLLAAFDAVLARYTGQRDIVVGSPIAGRNRRELEPVVGFFANTLVLRVGVEPDASFRQLVQRVRATCLDAYAHQDLPFEQLVDVVKPARDLGRTPVFQILFGLQNTPFPEVALGESRLVPEMLDPGTANFDLTVSLEQRADGLAGWVEYSSDLFDRATIDRLLASYQVLLAAAIASPDDRLARLPLLADDERRMIVDDWNASASVSPGEPLASVRELVERQAGATPDAPAVIAGDVTLSYRELDRRAACWAGELAARGVGAGDRVALVLPRGHAFATLVLAVMKAGATYVPIDPTYPGERIAFMIDDCAARVVIREPIGDVPARAWQPRPIPRPIPRPDELAYVIYTSGSTGQPKGVAMPHGAVANLIAWQGTQSPRGLRTLQFASPSFDVSFQELFATWASGGCLVIASDDERRDPDELLAALRGHRIERLFLPFVALHQLAEAAHARNGIDGSNGLALRQVITAGEQLRITPAIAALFVRLPDCRLYNQYGPTETHVTTQLALDGDPASWDALPAIGRPIAGHRAYVLDDELQPVPIGVVGELYLAGAGVAHGYLARPALTAQRFVPDPFAPGRMYRTGDRAKYTPAGELVFLGRADDQVKLRGYRIELGEIEAALSSHPAVRGAAVVARDGRLIAYVACDDDVDSAAVKDHVRARLPDYMVPAVVVQLAALPLSPNGKIDRRALPAPDASASAHAIDRVAPRTALEQRVADVWTAVLGGVLGVHDSFFDAGGHSLLATQVIARLRRELGVELPVRALFEAPTIAELARRIEAAGGAATADTADADAGATAITPVDTRQPQPLAFAQQRLWFLAQLEPDGFTYNVPWFVRLRGALDVPALSAALDRVIARHAALRTRFVELAGEPRQIIDATAEPLALTVEPIAEAELAAHAIAEARRPFALATGPVIRARLLRIAGDDHVLVVTAHHLVCDGWSIAILAGELSAAYQHHALPTLALQYADFAAWQREHGPARFTDQLAYWTAQLAGSPALLELPTDRPRPPVQTTRGAAVARTHAPALLAGVRALAHREAATEFMILLAAFAALLARYTGQPDVVIGTPIAGRDDPALDGVIGMFVNTLAVRVDAGAASFRQLVGRVRDACLAAFAHQDLPFDQLVAALAPERAPSRTPIFQVMFAVQPAAGDPLAIPGLAARTLDLHPGMAKCDLSLFVTTGDAQLATTWEYNRDLFDAPTIERMAACFDTLLGALIADPVQPPAAPPLLAAGERDRMLALGTVASAFPDASLPALVAAQVARAPDATAIVFGDVRLSYAALDARANRLARYLIARGVAPGDRVGVCLGRSADFVACVLAAVKAGACYVPLDPGYPVERLAYMAADAGVRVVLVRRGAGAPDLRDMTGAPIWLDDLDATLASLPADAPAPARATTSRDLAYIMYTSGSTGRPKGVCIEQRSIARLVLATDYVQLTCKDVVAHASNTSFDAATFEIWGALLTGATLYGLAPDVVLAPDALVRALAAGGVTALFVTTALFHQLAELAPRALHTVEHLLFGGEQLDAGAVRRVLAAGPPRRLLHVYGPTETTTFATWQLVGDVAAGATTLPIGRPIAGTTVRILDAQRNLVPIGVRGELYIGGPGLARGYWNRPELTAERFVDDPFAPGARLYRTGDLAAWRADGAIDFHGRADHQVKLRGFRVELGEIEAQLTAAGELATATVILRRDGDEPRLVAYVVPRAGVALDVDALQAQLAQALPRYMLPSAIVALDRLPVTPNGKLDRAALPAPSGEGRERAGDYVAPDGALERALAEAWARVLGIAVDHISARDSFFALGGSSLGLIAVRARLEARLARPVALAAIVEAPDLAALARRLADAGTTSTTGATGATASCLIQLQPGTTARPPVFFVHPGGGLAVVYRDLARAIDPDRAMYGFTARGIADDEPPHASIEAMARDYVALAREVQPAGPYLLAGSSFGGMVAYEMARQLTAAGETVALCALLDAPGPGVVADVDAAALIEFHLAAARTAGAGLPFDDVAHGRRLAHVWQHLVRLARAYTAPPWPDGDVQFFAATEQQPGVTGTLADGWRGRCRLHVELAAGDHLSMIAPPHHASLAAQIRRLLPRSPS